MEKKKINKQWIRLAISLFVGILMTMREKYIYGFGFNLWLVFTTITLITYLLTYLFDRFRKETKKEDIDKRIEEIKKIPTKELGIKISEMRKEEEYLVKELKKRKDRSYSDLVSESFMSIIYGGTTIFLCGLIYLGAIPSYFGVNNELTNPSNSSFGINKSMEIIGNLGIDVTTSLNRVGENNPTFWFWFFWILVAYFIVYPMIKIIYYLIKGGFKKK